ncbi:unnamed protein product [Pleuronectes platessa]|uniref:Uncharacterized protein n=1 Tax=Pleuronectes platessa TaxID=8262 RepID=A0A9N7Y6U6_PLEPL|nr:unnamed protein product [Pleuronectes platessa]
MLHVLGDWAKSHKGVKNLGGHSYWSLWSKTCEVTGANIRRGRKAATASLSYIAKGGAWLIQLLSLSNPQPEGVCLPMCTETGSIAQQYVALSLNFLVNLDLTVGGGGLKTSAPLQSTLSAAKD